MDELPRPDLRDFEEGARKDAAAGVVIQESKVKGWLTAAVATLTDPTSDVLTVSEDLDLIDPGWGWFEAYMREAATLFQKVAGLVPFGWDGMLTMTVALNGSDMLVTAEPHPGLTTPYDHRAPKVCLFAPRYFTTVPDMPREEYRWIWDDDPWGVTDSSTRVWFVSSRSHEERERDGKYRNVVEFRRYCGRPVEPEAPASTDVTGPSVDRRGHKLVGSLSRWRRKPRPR
jgi:hypothetical protein